MFKNFLASITHNAISLIGTAIAVAALVLMASLFGMEFWGFEGGPYLGILTYLILPMIFVVGLILIPIGAVLYRRRLRRAEGGDDTPSLPVFDLNIQAQANGEMLRARSARMVASERCLRRSLITHISYGILVMASEMRLRRRLWAAFRLSQAY